MPIQKAAFKSIRKDKKRRLKNLRVTSQLKTIGKRFSSLVSAKSQKEAAATLRALISKIGKAASKGIIHKNTASRKISRLNKVLDKLKKSALSA